jgi:hypothetical protein
MENSIESAKTQSGFRTKRTRLYLIGFIIYVFIGVIVYIFLGQYKDSPVGVGLIEIAGGVAYILYYYVGNGPVMNSRNISLDM